MQKDPTKRKRHGGTIAVGGVLQKRLVQLGLDKGVVMARLLENWREICPLLCKVSAPLSCHKGVLRVAVAHDSVKQELLYHGPAVMGLINQLVGHEAVTRIVAVNQPLPDAKAAQATKGRRVPPVSLDTARMACEAVDDDELREALARLGQWLMEEEKVS